MSANSERPMRLAAILLGSFYVASLIPATPLAYAGMLWLGASERGWRTQVAAGALVAGHWSWVLPSCGRP
jgi:hypothetical protein